MTLEELSDHTYNGMMNHALHSVAALFEADGWGPCDSIKAANELLKPAWDAWNTLIERVTADDRKITALEAELSAIRSAQEWQPMETAPKDREVDVWAGGERYMDCRYDPETSRWLGNVTSYGEVEWQELDPQPIAWMLPPSPPRAEGGEE